MFRRNTLAGLESCFFPAEQRENNLESSIYFNMPSKFHIRTWHNIIKRIFVNNSENFDKILNIFNASVSISFHAL